MQLENQARNAMADAVAALVANGGYIQYVTSGSNQVAKPVLGAVSPAANGTATFTTFSTDNNATGGTIDHALLKTSGNALIATMSAGTAGSGSEMIVANVTITAAQAFAQTAFSITVPVGTY